jgi:two-component sensor histidine kinase
MLTLKGVKHILFATEDITERDLSEKKIRQSLQEKESLLREIHHRVKNNLAVISSLIGLQVRQIKDENIREMFDVCQHRIKTMALIHERLYRSADLSAVHFQEYIHHLVGDLMSSYHRPGGKKIDIDIDAHQIFLDIDTAIPCGLIINELLTNAFKHAFSDTVDPKITITFHKTEDTYTLTIQDNGIGIPNDFNKSETATLGLMLVHALTRQLKGDVRFQADTPAWQGTAVTITFQVRSPNGRTETSY